MVFNWMINGRLSEILKEFAQVGGRDGYSFFHWNHNETSIGQISRIQMLAMNCYIVKNGVRPQ